MKKINLIVAAAGLSQRYGTDNKLFAPCGTSCVLIEAIKPFLSFHEITKIIVATDTTYFDEFMSWLSVLHLDEDARITASIGGSTRTKTVRNAVSSIEDDCSLVLVHDGARPFVSTPLIKRIIDAASEYGAALPVLPLTDSLINSKDGAVPVDRADFGLVQTPFGCDRNAFCSAYAKCAEDEYDDYSVLYKNGVRAVTVAGEKENIKITTKTDLKTPLVGCGYDIHRLEKGRGIKLLGTFINCPFSFAAHSDGDVPVHAIMDAMLSAVGEKDIGHLFPVDDPAYDNADSVKLLEKVLEIVEKKGFKPVNLSVSIIAEKPLIAPYIDEMRARMSAALSISPDRIGVTATTNEQVGDIGDGNAIAAYATVLLNAN